MMGFKIGYFLKLRHEPKYDTLTWTLDYRYNSDFGKFICCCLFNVLSAEKKIGLSWLLCIYIVFILILLKCDILHPFFDHPNTDDNVGHWQVMAHPEKKDWTRVLYSCKIKLFPWVPSFAINYLTTKALTEVRYCTGELRIDTVY